MIDRATRRSPRAALVVGAMVLALGLGGCADAAVPTPAPTSAPPTTTESTPEPTTQAPPPVLVPEGSASDNLPFFAMIVDEIWAGEERYQGRAYIDALTEAGFDREQMQVTRDHTTIGRPAESIQFSVAWDEKECLIGQIGPSTGEPVVTVMSRLALGNCLIGNTRPIDW